MVIYRVSNVYLSCIYRICNVIDRGRGEEFIGRSQASYRLKAGSILRWESQKQNRWREICSACMPRAKQKERRGIKKSGHARRDTVERLQRSLEARIPE